MKPKYSGAAGRKFWNRIAAIKPDKLRVLIYLAGCALQDHETRVLQMVTEAKAEEEMDEKRG